MKRLLPLLSLALFGCHKNIDYNCVCTFKDGKVYSDHDYVKGWKKKTRDYCRTQLGSFGDLLGVTCDIYDTKDDFYRCQEYVKYEAYSLPQFSDTNYFFADIPETTINLFKAEHTYIDTLKPGNYVRTHSVTCSKDILALY